METKEIAMSKSTKFLGTACVLAVAALAASPVAAAPLTEFAGVLGTDFGWSDNDAPATESIKSWLIGGSVAAPIPDVAGMAVQFDAAFKHNWADGYSREDWDLGGSLFWGGMESRVGINGDHVDLTNIGHVNNIGAFGEYYFGTLTVMGKGGWLNSGGSGFGGHGNYVGLALAAYVTPNISVTGAVEWSDLIQGQACTTCGRGSIQTNGYHISGEMLVVPTVGLAAYLSYAYLDTSHFNTDIRAQTARIGLRWYFGSSDLMTHHRNGNLNPYLVGVANIKEF
jgi:hypothetical protein